jgi:hypothetical protein
MQRSPAAAPSAPRGPFARLGRWVSATPRAVSITVALATVAAGI